MEKRVGWALVLGAVLFSGCASVPREVDYPVPPAPAPEPDPVVVPDPPAPAPEPPAPAPAPDPAPAAKPDPRLYSNLVTVIQSSMPEQTVGIASAIQFVNYTNSNTYVTVGTSDRGVTPLENTPNAGLSTMMNDKGEVLAIVLGSTKPGHYDCATSQFGIGFAFADEDITSDVSSWSDRAGGSCSFDVYAGDNPGDLQGTYSGVLTTNEGHSLTIDKGYFYARNPSVYVDPTPAWNAGPTVNVPAKRTYHR